MKLYVMFKQSLKAIFRNKGRSFLTILGIIIGIGSVIALISLGNGVKATISDRIATLGTTNLTIMPGGQRNFGGGQSSSQRGGPGFSQNEGPSGFGNTSTLTVDDLKSLQDKSKNPKLKAVTGDISGSTILKVSGEDTRFSVLGTSVSYFNIHNLNLKSGALYTDNDVQSKTKAAVLGSEVADEVFGTGNPLNQTFMIENDTYKVIGVLSKANESGFGNPNAQIFVPNLSAMATFGNNNFNSMTAQAIDDNSVDQAKTDIQNTLLSAHKISEAKLADFTVFTSRDLLSTVGNVTGILTSLLAGIAAISLVVGGIGIMNIMLVSVTERTREIGLRKAVGARTIDILEQFILEAVILTLVGGVLGIGLGTIIGKVAARFVGFAPIVTLSSVFLAVGVSSAIGLIFGIYPAAKAARLDPIETLRYE